MTEELNWARMAARRRPARTVLAGEGPPLLGEETSSTRKKKEEVLNQARAVLRQSQQFRPTITSASDKKNNNLNSKLAFQQPTQEDFWTPGGLVVDSTSLHQQRFNPLSEVVNKQTKGKLEQEDDFGLPFRDAVRRSPVSALRLKSSGGGGGTSQASSSSTTISMNTADLNVSSGSDVTASSDSDSSHGSISSVKKKVSITRKTVKLNAAEPATLKLTPLTPAPTALGVETIKPGDTAPPGVFNSNVESESELISNAPSGTDKMAPPGSTKVKPTPASGMVEEDENGFSRAHVKKSETDPHWFEKALLVRGESISAAAYKSFKQVQSPQDAADEAFHKGGKRRKHPPIFSNLTDPEYTADWISEPDIGDTMNGSEGGEMDENTDVPVSDILDFSGTNHDYGEGEIEENSAILNSEDVINLNSNIDDPDLSSQIKTASELEKSGVLEEIAETLHSVLEISEKPELNENDYERSSAQGYYDDYDNDELIEPEPLKSIFHDIFTNPEDENNKEATEKSVTVVEEEIRTPPSKSKSLSQSKSNKRESPTIGNIWVQYEGDDYDDTFIQGSSKIHCGR